MAVKKEATIARFIGLSTDEKPVWDTEDADTRRKLPAGSSFLEKDTGEIWRFDGQDWWPPAGAGESAASVSSTIVSELADLKDYLLDVTHHRPRNLEAGEKHIGQVGGYEVRVQGRLAGMTLPPIPAAGNYAALDVISDSTSAGSLWHFPNCARQNGGGGYIKKLIATASAASMVTRLRLWLFHTGPSASAKEDNAAFDLKAADRQKVTGYLDTTALADVGDVAMGQNFADTLEFVCASDSRDLFGILVAVDAETNEAANMTISLELGIIQTT